MRFKKDLFLLCLPKGGKDFSLIFTVETWLSSWGKPHKILRLHYDWVSLELLILRVVYTEPLASVNYNSGSPTPLLLSWRFLLVGFCSVMVFCIHLSLSPILGANVCPVTSLLLWLLQDCWFFSLFSILLVLYWSCWHLSSLHVGPETRSPQILTSLWWDKHQKEKKAFRNLNSYLKLLWYPNTQFYIL